MAQFPDRTLCRGAKRHSHRAKQDAIDFALALCAPAGESLAMQGSHAAVCPRILLTLQAT